ncbi:hypothetical protein BGW38_007261 [Lunasporangiospora selenospora]|uniref:Uncharacterized protein n=1 Tax=Lunasporangiospora selenospora TaxID=979761 RepID=A0A9P6G0M8_9FUNG|nr:hypothetical protein BGW38_007261 [Lunasporangiospora selenospora]
MGFRNLFLSENQKQVEAEARNIGLAHTIRDLITGSNHETHLDTYQKQQAVKALQKAKPHQVNELITILKAMPDPSVVEFKDVHSREASRHLASGRNTPLSRPSTPAPLHAAPSPPSTAPASTDAGSSLSSSSMSLSEEAKRKGKGRKEPALLAVAGSSQSARNSQEQDRNDEETAEEIKTASSWWAVSFSNILASLSSTSKGSEPPVTTTTTTTTTTTIVTEEDDDGEEGEGHGKEHIEGTEQGAQETVQRTVETEEQGQSTPPGGQETPVATDASHIKTGSNGRGTVTKTTTTTTSTIATELASADKAVVVSTINSIKKQVAALIVPPPTNIISAYTYWWGYEIYVPHKCMSKLQRVTNTSQIFFGFLSGAVQGIPGLAVLVPLSRIISAWVGFQWSVIQAEDLGKGVVLSATWVLPVALAPRSWDHPGTEDDPEPEKPRKGKQKRITG